MIEHHIDIETDDGTMATFISHPDAGGPYPVVLFLMDAPGKREELHDMARRISATGYYVMLSNLYYREVRSFTLHREDPASADTRCRCARFLMAIIFPCEPFPCRAFFLPEISGVFI